MQLRGNLKHLVFLVIAVSLSAAYLVSAFKKGGVWSGIVFVLVWVAVFWYQNRRSRKP
jgi:hypothetical protein